MKKIYHDKKGKLILPEIGQLVTPEWAFYLALHFLGHDHYITKRIFLNSYKLKSFTFDGCSFVPDDLFEKWSLLGVPWSAIKIFACLVHDLGYYVGLPIKDERYLVDKMFRTTILRLCREADLDYNMSIFISNTMFNAVRGFGGSEWGIRGVSWGFGW